MSPVAEHCSESAERTRAALTCVATSPCLCTQERPSPISCPASAPRVPTRCGTRSTALSGRMSYRRPASARKASISIYGADPSAIGILLAALWNWSSVRVASRGSQGWQYGVLWQATRSAQCCQRTQARGRLFRNGPQPSKIQQHRCSRGGALTRPKQSNAISHQLAVANINNANYWSALAHFTVSCWERPIRSPCLKNLKSTRL